LQQLRAAAAELRPSFLEGGLSLNRPSPRPGVPQRDFFTINRNGRIVLKEHGVGGPQPPSDPMSLEQFADFVLATALEEKTA